MHVNHVSCGRCQHLSCNEKAAALLLGNRGDNQSGNTGSRRGSAEVMKKSASSNLTALLTKFLLGLYQARIAQQGLHLHLLLLEYVEIQKCLSKSCHQPSFPQALSPSAKQRGTVVHSSYQTTKPLVRVTSWETELQ